MSDLSKKTILAQGQEQIARSIEPLADYDKAAVVVTSDTETHVRVGGAVDLGKGFSAGGHVEKPRDSGWGWFLGAMWRKKK